MSKVLWQDEEKVNHYGTEYCVSRTYDATDILELPKIVFILRKLKWLILNDEY